ncbi:MAG: hypothetical protein ACYDCQ_13630 [Dehalococcoidia bacterium]
MERRVTAVMVTVVAGAAAAALVLTACGSGASRPAVDAGQAPAPSASAELGAATAPSAATPVTTPIAAQSGRSATPPPEATPTSSKAAESKAALANLQLDANAIAAGFQRRGLQIGQVQSVTSQTDPDSQLGKSGEYASRVDFIDTGLPAQPGAWNVESGGAIEVFASVSDAIRARKQLTTAANRGGQATEVNYQAGTVVLRLSPRLSEVQQANYETATRDMVEAAVKREEGRTGKAPAATATPVAKP